MLHQLDVVIGNAMTIQYGKLSDSMSPEQATHSTTVNPDISLPHSLTAPKSPHALRHHGLLEVCLKQPTRWGHREKKEGLLP